MSTIRTGVIGVGHLGYHHARLYAAIDGSELVGVVDTDAAHREKAANDFNVPAFDSVAALIDAGVDAVSIAVPTTLHHNVGMELINAGVDVLVEKPIASTEDLARELVETAKAADRILQVGHIERFNGAVVALFDAVRKPRFIECQRLSPYPNRGDDVSVILDLMIHDLDIVRALDPSPVVSVDAVGVPVFSEQEDIANCRIRFESGCVADVSSSRVSLERTRKIRIFEEHAYISTDYIAQEVKVYRRNESAPATAGPMELIQVESLNVKREEPLKLELEAFLNCVRERTRPVVSGEDGLAALELAHTVIDFIRQSG